MDLQLTIDSKHIIWQNVDIGEVLKIDGEGIDSTGAIMLYAVKVCIIYSDICIFLV